MATLLNYPARFSDGPFRLAQLLRRRLVFMVGLYRGGNRYDIHIERLAHPAQRPSRPGRDQRRGDPRIRPCGLHRRPERAHRQREPAQAVRFGRHGPCGGMQQLLGRRERRADVGCLPGFN